MSRLFESLSHASLYAKFRPLPPIELINAIIGYLSEKIPPNRWRTAVDIGCGSGQSTQPLSQHFKHVYGFDISQAQISQAIKLNNNYNNISYKVSSAEHLPLENNSVELLIASQAVHWFDLPKFFTEVNRVLTPNGALALFGYKMPYVSHPNFANDDRLSSLVNTFYTSPLLSWSKKEREVVDGGYESITIPYNDCIRKDCFSSHSSASAKDLKGYIMSWSGFNTVKNIDQEKSNKFLSSFDQKIRSIFGDTDMDDIEFEIHYNFFLIIGRKPDVSEEHKP